MRGGRRFVYELEKTTPRKTLSLRVHRDGRIAVKSPDHLHPDQVHDFVGRKSVWIAQRQRYFSEMMRRHPPKELKAGESFLLLGRSYRLRLTEGGPATAPACRIDGRRLSLTLPPNMTPSDTAWPAIREWYSAMTKRRVNAAVRKHAPALAVRPGKIRIVDQSNRWASCSRNGDIRCNWRLSMMPAPVLEYVVAHELCHLRIVTHSPQFWRLVKSLLPDFEKQRGWLRENGPGIAFSTQLQDRLDERRPV